MENTQPLKATIRENLGKGPARRLRVAGRLPGVVYGKDFASTNVSVEPKALLNRLRGDYGLNSIFKLEIEGHDASPVVRVINYQRDPVRRSIKHVDFEVLNAESLLTTKVPLKLEAAPPASLRVALCVRSDTPSLSRQSPATFRQTLSRISTNWVSEI
jgi:large subunit ribosomal protein L25